MQFFIHFIHLLLILTSRVDGSTIDAPLTSFLESNPNSNINDLETTLQVNDVVTFSFSSRSKLEHLVPVLSSIRPDLLWEDVVADHTADIPRRLNANGYCPSFFFLPFLFPLSCFPAFYTNSK